MFEKSMSILRLSGDFKRAFFDCLSISAAFSGPLLLPLEVLLKSLRKEDVRFLTTSIKRASLLLKWYVIWPSETQASSAMSRIETCAYPFLPISFSAESSIFSRVPVVSFSRGSFIGVLACTYVLK